MFAGGGDNRKKNENHKLAAKRNWGSRPCGSRNIGKRDISSLNENDFIRLDRARYDYEKWMQTEFDGLQLEGKRVLEIGYGMGSDHLQLAKRGAILYGIDLTARNLPICTRHLELSGYSSQLIIGDAENLPYEDGYFDVVYTFGVIHHIPNMEKVVEEIYRVLKPGGIVWCGVYNKDSWFYRCKLLPEYIRSGDFLRMTVQEKLSLIEYPNNRKDILVRLTTKKELKYMFRKFSIIELKNRSISRAYFKIKGRVVLSNQMIDDIGNRFGWYNIIIARK